MSLQKINAQILSPLKIGQVLRNSKRHGPESTLQQPENAAQIASLALGLTRKDISIQEEHPASQPAGSNSSGQLGVFQSSDQGEEHSLRGILEEVGVGALGAVELFSLGLHYLLVYVEDLTGNGLYFKRKKRHVCTFDLHCSTVA